MDSGPVAFPIARHAEPPATLTDSILVTAGTARRVVDCTVEQRTARPADKRIDAG